MPLQATWRIRPGDTFRSKRYAVIVDGQPVDLDAPGWTVRAELRDGTLPGAFHVLHGTATVRIGDTGPDITTSTVQAALTAGETTALTTGGRVDLELRRAGGDTIDDTDWVTTLVEADVTIADTR